MASRVPFELRLDQQACAHLLPDIDAHRIAIRNLLIPLDWQEDLRRLNIVRAVFGTTAIEGNPRSLAQVRRQLFPARGRRGLPARPGKHELEIRNVRQADEWIRRHFDPARFQAPPPLTEDTVLRLHELLTRDSDEEDNVPGAYRATDQRVTVGSPALGGVWRPPPGGEVMAKLMARALEFLNSGAVRDQHPVIQALVAHFYLVTLHRFGNGNGRTARALEALILFQHGVNTYGFYSLSNHFYRHRSDYFRLLQATRLEERYDLTRFVVFGLEGFRDELARINAYVQGRLHRLLYRDLIQRAFETRVGPRRRLLNRRERAVLEHLLDRSPPDDPFGEADVEPILLQELLTSRAFRQLYGGVTSRTMRRELIRLEQRGFIRLEEEEEARGAAVQLKFNVIARYPQRETR